MRIRDQGGGVQPSNLERIFSYAFTTAGRRASHDSDGDDGGPYAAQHVGGSAAVSGGSGNSDSGLFGEITSKGIQTGMGTIAGLGYGLPMSRLYAKSVTTLSIFAIILNFVRYFGGSLDFFSLEGWGKCLHCLQASYLRRYHRQ